MKCIEISHVQSTKYTGQEEYLFIRITKSKKSGENIFQEIKQNNTLSDKNKRNLQVNVRKTNEIVVFLNNHTAYKGDRYNVITVLSILVSTSFVRNNKYAKLS